MQFKYEDASTPGRILHQYTTDNSFLLTRKLAEQVIDDCRSKCGPEFSHRTLSGRWDYQVIEYDAQQMRYGRSAWRKYSVPTKFMMLTVEFFNDEDATQFDLSYTIIR